MALDQRADYRQIATYARLDEAEVARGMLEADGIPAALLDQQVAALGLGPAVGGVRLLVPAWDEARALELLAQPVAWPADGPATTPTPLPGTLGTVVVPSLTAPAPVAAQPGPLALRVAVWVALALAVAALVALR